MSPKSLYFRQVIGPKLENIIKNEINFKNFELCHFGVRDFHHIQHVIELKKKIPAHSIYIEDT